MRRNGAATGELAEACAARGLDLVVVSTNEVFDGARTDGRGYRPDDDPARPIPTARASSAGRAGGPATAYADRAVGSARQLAIVRTAWLYGPPGNDFPAKIVAAAERAAAAGEPLRVVGDEFGRPTSPADLAEAIVELLGSGAIAGTTTASNVGVVSRADVGARGAAPGRGRGGHRGGPGRDLGPRLDTAALGRPRAEPARRPASRCGRGTEAMADYAPCPALG